MAMGTPKKPVNKKVDSKNTGEDEDDDDSMLDQKSKKKVVDEDDDFDGPLDDLGYENFEDYDDDEDYWFLIHKFYLKAFRLCLWMLFSYR